MNEEEKLKAAIAELHDAYDEYHNVTLPMQQAQDRAIQEKRAKDLLLCGYTDWVSVEDDSCRKPAAQRITLKPCKLTPGEWEPDTKWRFFARSCDEHCQKRVEQLKKGWKVLALTPFNPLESQEPRKIE
jgi:hypothetical protein